MLPSSCAANDMQNCLLVSDAYHMFRAKQMMEAQGHQGLHLAASGLNSEDDHRTIPRRYTGEFQLHAV